MTRSHKQFYQDLADGYLPPGVFHRTPSLPLLSPVVNPAFSGQTQPARWTLPPASQAASRARAPEVFDLGNLARRMQLPDDKVLDWGPQSGWIAWLPRDECCIIEKSGDRWSGGRATRRQRHAFGSSGDDCKPAWYYQLLRSLGV